ncbi:hypothetical protein ACJJTC_016414 [Scirpophaga incertulas]
MAPYSVLLVALLSAVVAAAEVIYMEKEKLELEAYIQEKLPQINDRYKLDYHLTPRVGWMSDPNGFSFFNGLFHMFYQFYPYASRWGPMHWGHAVSSDLVHWNQLPTALIPEDEMCFSGSAIQYKNLLVLMYSGRRKTPEVAPFKNESQYLAYSTDGVDFAKYENNPVLSYTPNNAADFRDPKVWKHGDYYYVVIGSTKDSDTGRVLLYRSEDLRQWEFLRVLAESKGDLGFLWACPDFFELNGKYVLLISPQGIQPQGDRYKNAYQTGYLIGDFNYETFEFVPETEFQELDFGHDFYVAQTMEENGKRYVVGWFSMWEQKYPEAEDGWAGALTLVRELKLYRNQLVQKPVLNMVQLRSGVVASGRFMPQSTLNFGRTGEILIYAPDLSRTMEILLEEGNNDIRQVEWNPIQSHTLRIFLDASSMELFCGEGEIVFSTRVYKLGNWKVTNLSLQTLTIDAYRLSKSIKQ